MFPLRTMLNALLCALPVALACSACVSIPAASKGDGGEPADAGPLLCNDADGDGYLAFGCVSTLPIDCEPGIAEIHPGAYDACNNSIDEDCSGQDALCDDSIPGIAVSETDNGNVVTVTTAAGVTGFDYREGFSIVSLVSNAFGTANLVHTGGNRERLIGSHLFNTTTGIYSHQAVIGANEGTVTTLTSGRAVLQYQVDWSVSNKANDLAGTTTYTFYPGGRIHRAEALTASGTNRPFVTYIALDPASFSHRLNPTTDPLEPLPLLTTPPADGDVDQPLGASGIGLAVGRGCAYNEEVDHPLEGLALSYAWNAYQGADDVRVRMPESTFNGGHQFAMTLDWVRAGGVTLKGSYRGAFLLELGQTSKGENVCGNFEPSVSGFLNPPILANALTRGLGDSNEDGYVEDGGFYALSAAGATSVEVDFETFGPAPANYALHLSELPNDFDPVLFLEGSNVPLLHGEHYLMDRAADGSLWFYVRIPIDPNNPLTIVFPEVVSE